MITSHRYTSLSDGSDPVDFGYLDSFYRNVSSLVIDYYYRAELIGFENIPENGPVIIASNHSGNAFPHDSFVLDQLLWKSGNFAHSSKIRPLYSPKLAINWWMRPFGLDNWWRLFGAIDQTYINFDRVLAQGKRVIYYPEGIPGIGKGFNRKYQLQPFQPSFVKLSARYNVPVIPVYGINAEWINPASLTSRWLDRLFSKLLGIPFIPIPIAILALIFPFFFYFGFPCNMKFVVGNPISTRDWLRSRGCALPENPQKDESKQLATEIRKKMQQELNQYVDKYGKKPYNFTSLFKSLKKIRGKRWLVSPFGWPILFTRHYRDYYDTVNNRQIPNRWLRDWDLVGYYIPLGWIFLAIVRKLRKHPYGSRGLAKEDKLKKEGKYIWSVAKESYKS